jgi:hypothetical protein
VDDCVKKLKEAFACDDSVRKNAIATASGFSVEKFVDRMTELYDDVVAKKKGAGDV